MATTPISVSNGGASPVTKPARRSHTTKKSKRTTRPNSHATAPTSIPQQQQQQQPNSYPIPYMIDPNRVVPPHDQIQYKIKLLLHINNLLLARVINVMNLLAKHNEANNKANDNSSSSTSANGGLVIPENLQLLMSQNLKRVHANLQCISQMNQGFIRAKPAIFTIPGLGLQNPQQQQQQGDSNNNIDNNNVNSNDILVKLYLVLARVLEFWWVIRTVRVLLYGPPDLLFLFLFCLRLFKTRFYGAKATERVSVQIKSWKSEK